MDPNMFPINKLSGELLREYESVWESLRGKKMLR